MKTGTLHFDFEMGYVLIWKLIDYPKTNIASCFCIKNPLRKNPWMNESGANRDEYRPSTTRSVPETSDENYQVAQSLDDDGVRE